MPKFSCSLGRANSSAPASSAALSRPATLPTRSTRRSAGGRSRLAAKWPPQVFFVRPRDDESILRRRCGEEGVEQQIEPFLGVQPRQEQHVGPSLQLRPGSVDVCQCGVARQSEVGRLDAVGQHERRFRRRRPALRGLLFRRVVPARTGPLYALAPHGEIDALYPARPPQAVRVQQAAGFQDERYALVDGFAQRDVNRIREQRMGMHHVGAAHPAADSGGEARCIGERSGPRTARRSTSTPGASSAKRSP